MLYQVMADGLVLLHLLFICFVVLGGLLIYRWRWILFLHLPAVTWGTLLEFNNWLCPLTPLEQRFRLAGGEAGYRGGFIEHYLLPIIYPADLTREVQTCLGIIVIVANLLIYGILLARLLRDQQH